MIERLRELRKQKKSYAHYAEILSKETGEVVTVEEVRDLMKDLNNSPELDIEGNTHKYNLEKGTYEISVYYDHPPQPEEVIKDHKIDTKKFKLSAYYSKAKEKGWQVTALFKNIAEEESQIVDFQEFIKTYKSPHQIINKFSWNTLDNEGILLINKQDSHLNKYSINGGNDILDRFQEYYDALVATLTKSSMCCNLSKVIYVIGSDQFNSEWTNTTTKGTPQQNILPYHVSFQLVCDQETKIINTLLKYADNVEIVSLVGNHDQYVSWHMVSWLKAYYKDQDNLEIDITPDFTKFRSIYDSAVCLNHGDAQKPERLATNFPHLYKRGFAEANHWFIITGDKHTEQTKQIGGIKFYQIPVQSKAVSEWDSKNGYTTTKAEMISFLFEKGKGISLILKEQI